ncbi:MAG: TonB family protein [Steroidobacteraceae bacterium]
MIALVVDSALRTLLVAGVAGMVLGALRVRNPYVLKTLWTAVLSIGLLMPLLLHCRIIAAPISSAGLPAISIASPVASVPQTSRSVLEAVYAAVSLVLLGRLALGIGQMFLVRRHAVRVERRWVGRFDVRMTASLASPVTFGSTILLPENYPSWSAAKRTAVLVHEGAHVEQRDCYIQWLALLHSAVFWFSPFSWWLTRHLAALAEQTSDEAVLREDTDRTVYASLLLEFARARSGARPAVAMTGGGLAQRIERIISGSPLSAGISAWKKAAIVGVLLPTVVWAASSWRPSMTEPGLYRVAEPESEAPRSAQASAGPPTVASWSELDRYYPRAAQRAGIEGSVRIAVTLDRGGRPTHVVVLSAQPTGYGFGAAASLAAGTAFRYRNPSGRAAQLVLNVKFALSH